MVEIPAEGDQPRIQLFETVDELREHTGQNICHGYFDAANKLIVATYDSVAHEIGHYRDFQSGKLRVIQAITDPTLKMEAILRNEIVACLYARTKLGANAATMEHEAAFLEWISFMREQKAFGPHTGTSLDDLKLSQIQEIAEWVVDSSHPWFRRLEFIFRHYLLDFQVTLTYGVRPKRRQREQ